jgi:hypothetical protein
MGFVPMGMYQNQQQTMMMREDPKTLPVGFQPTPYSVLFGRGKKCTQSCGNRRLRVIAMMFLDKYAKAESKDQKSEIVTEIQDTVNAACPFGRGAFVRQSCHGRWMEVDSIMAREKISQVLRDLLHNKYRSSVKNKMANRRKQRMEARGSITSTETSSSEEFNSESSSEFGFEFCSELVSQEMIM